MKAIRLRCEYLKNPIGIDIEDPRLFWICDGGITQTAYRIVAQDDDGKLVADTGKIISARMTGVRLNLHLTSREKVLWRVKLWDENNVEGEWSAFASFESGIKPEEWQAKWISGNYKVDKKKRYPVDCFMKAFSSEKEIKKARLYVTACGLYEVEINKKRVGSFVLAPGCTDYKKRIQYQTYDVTNLIKPGENKITAQLADGWYRGSVGAWGIRNQYGTQTKLLAQLEVTYADNTVKMVVTDKSWNWSNDGEIRFADNKDGEIVDARNIPLYNNKAIETFCNVAPSASNNVAVVEKERFSPKKIITPTGKTVLDFSQNIAGYIEFNISAKAKKKLKLLFGEMLDERGEFTQKNIQCSSKRKTSPLQKIEYVCKDGKNHYKTKFAVFGFQYVSVDADFEINEKDFTAVAVYSDIEQTGFFDSSNKLLNKFYDATLWSTKGNSLDLPTDCPTRERHGWTGDAQIFFETAAYMFDYAAFSEKYLRDIYDWQKKDGRLPQIAPYGGVDFYMWVMNGSVGWSDAGVLIPYRFYKIYGDKKILIDYYGQMKKYSQFMIDRIGKKGGVYAVYTKPLPLRGEAKRYIVNYGQSYGEWAEPKDVHANKWTDMVTPHPEVSTAYTAFIMKTMAEIAQIVGRNEDIDRFNHYYENCKKAYQELVKTEEFSLDTNRQANLVRPLYMNLLNDAQTDFAKKRLVKALDSYGWRVGTGFLSTPLILSVLSDIDIEFAYRLLENEEMPGWLFMTKNNATTVWESWEGTKAQGGIASLNHYSKGAVCEWLFKTMCGINVDGENHFIVSPKPGGSFEFAQAEYNSLWGEIISKWHVEGARIIYEIAIPPNTTAKVILPDGKEHDVTAGNHSFETEGQLPLTAKSQQTSFSSRQQS